MYWREKWERNFTLLAGTPDKPLPPSPSFVHHGRVEAK
jgi:hypothetical protein